MSRLIVKNLSTKTKPDHLKEIFSHYGTLTDVKLIFNKDGKFRKFAFVGFHNNDEAQKAKQALNNSLIVNQKVVVQFCKDFGVKEKANSSKLSNKSKKVSQQQLKKSANKSDLDFLSSKTNPNYIDDDSDNEGKSNPSSSGKETEKQSLAIKLKGCPVQAKQQQIEEFFYPLKPSKIKFVRSKFGKKSGIVIVNFLSKNDHKEALNRNGDYIQNNRIDLKKYSKDDCKISSEDSNKNKWISRMVKNHENCEVEDISESGKLFIRNLSYTCTENDLTALFEKYGPVSEVNIPIDNTSKKSVGFGFITFMFPQHALLAFNKLDGTVFQGRMLHILPAKVKDEHKESENPNEKSSFKKSKVAADKKSSQSSHNWNSLFIGASAVADAISEKYDIDKSDILDSTNKHSAAVRMALGETHIVKETRDFLIENGISLDAFSQPNAERSKSVILVKNLPAGATSSELRDLFEQHAQLGRVVLAPAGVTAVVECLEPSEARNAFTKLAYRNFHRTPLYLEWAPIGTFVKPDVKPHCTGTAEELPEEAENIESENGDISNGLTLFVKNLNFDTTDESLKEHFSQCGPLLLSMVSKKKTHNSNSLLSMGYGFVSYKNAADGKAALKILQHSMLDGHKLELKLSERKQPLQNKSHSRKRQEMKKQKSTKILVRNIPFQANTSEISSLFKSFGELKTVRLPKKLSATLGQTGSHRGFAFVDFVTKEDAKNAFNALCHSTHLYGRRLVLEWADTDETSVDILRKKTVDHFHGNKPKRRRLNSLEESVAAADVDSE